MQTVQNPELKLAAIVNISDFTDVPSEYELNSNDNQWVREILGEIEGDFFDDELPKGEGLITANLSIKRLVNNIYGEHIVVRAHAHAKYYAACVRCLEAAPQEADAEFQVAFINSRFEKDPEYGEISHILADGEEAELYFHEKGKANIKELLHEQIYMSLDPLPLHDEECKGLCPQCGVNLNKESCGHGNAAQ
ncbi:hypothetical protein M899_2824 [Bacteriovorax sp. BSW11_IV]|uniref:DUF177 domain-containing protein n=1 Tax=Bacteriovorax sp. BSW11_IV TaxID=1353529 RepID=UPI00038A21E9|nr:DUF177 domain-containing protein [Bacteriovorax sp. BSW11_IV]EQC50120.1 hypothetical protein M899_2824 [Bacteriovorax sp. BSW11_IV]